MHPNYKGGRYLDSYGYVILSGKQDHANARKAGTIFEHVFIMSEYLGRPLYDWETVHHINGVRDDNCIENLQLRIGQHGTGWKYSCPDCGSDRVHPVEI